MKANGVPSKLYRDRKWYGKFREIGNLMLASIGVSRQSLLIILLLATLSQLAVSQEAKLSPTEQALLERNWNIAFRLVSYDYYSWIGSDSVVKYLDSTSVRQVKGWVVEGDSVDADVIFGYLEDTCLISIARVHFTGKIPLTPSTDRNCYPRGSRAYTLFSAVESMKSKWAKDIESDGVPFNAYALYDGDTISAYLFPGSTDDRLIFCGGYRSRFIGSDLRSLDETKLHGGPLIMKDGDTASTMFRTSVNSNLPNEVDLAQYLINYSRAPHQMIITKKYIFNLSQDMFTGKPTTSVEFNDKK